MVFTMSTDAVDRAGKAIADVAKEVSQIKMTHQFRDLAEAFQGATDPMRGLSDGGDDAVGSAIKNASGQIDGWSELVISCVGSLAGVDKDNADMINTAGKLPAIAVTDPKNAR